MASSGPCLMSTTQLPPVCHRYKHSSKTTHQFEEQEWDWSTSGPHLWKQVSALSVSTMHTDRQSQSDTQQRYPSLSTSTPLRGRPKMGLCTGLGSFRLPGCSASLAMKGMLNNSWQLTGKAVPAPSLGPCLQELSGDTAAEL